jgi:3-dehydroquinate dehydratase / shikimate dehydrogenase
MPAPTIKTERLILRQWENTDLLPFAAMNADPIVMEYFPAPLSNEESNQFANKIQKELSEEEFGLWAVEIPNISPFIGFIGLHRADFDADFCPCIEIGWRLAKEYWGKGYATEGAKAVLEYAFNTLKLNEVLSFTATINDRSQKVMRRIGMEHDLTGSFEHSMVSENSPIKPHVLYRKRKPVT